MQVREILEAERVVLALEVASKKRLLQAMAELLCTGRDDLQCDHVFKVLTERERLGSTGIGQGIALPHGRTVNVDAPLAAVARLKNPLAYDAVDGAPVALAFGLLIPQEASEAHLKILAALARTFSNAELREQLLATESAADFYALLCGASCG